MKSLPRFRLRTILVFFFCAAVGLAISPYPTGALQPAIATAMVIGLLQQLRVLWSSPVDEMEISNQLTLARRFAIVWRAFIAAVMAGCLILQLLTFRKMLALPEHLDVSLSEDLHEYVLSFCVVLVLCNSVARWQSTTAMETSSRRRIVWYWAIGILIGFVVVSDTSFIVYLVHNAAAGMEADIPQRFQRPGVYPDLRDEHYLTFWMASAALIALLAAAAVLRQSSRRGRGVGRFVVVSAIFVVLLGAAISFCYWYYTTEYRRLSPDLAGVGLASIWTDWAWGSLIAVILVTAGAYRLSRMDEVKLRVTDDLSHDLDRTALHESFPCLVLIIVNGIVELVFYFTYLGAVPAPALGIWFDAWLFATALCEPTMLLSAVAPAIAAIQLSRLRWRQRGQTVAWELPGLSLAAFLFNWVALALLLIVTMPTLYAFSFVFWLGPFNYIFP